MLIPVIPEYSEDVLLNVVVHLFIFTLLIHLPHGLSNHTLVRIGEPVNLSLHSIITVSDESSTRLVVHIIFQNGIMEAHIASLNQVIILKVLHKEQPVVLVGNVMHEALIQE